jgi:GNAT superfamily N-acetyltransferase
MSQLVIKPVSTRREKKDFLDFPWRLYQTDPHWIPPIRADEQELLGFAGRHPFYEKNRVQAFLAVRDGQVCGRIAAILNQVHNEVCNERRGFFGFFECLDDQEVANGLFDAASQWLAAQGIHRLRGPANPGVNYVWGTLIEGFDSPPTFMMAYNPPYYERLIEGYGFRKAQDLYAYWGDVEMLPAVITKYGALTDQIAERFKIRVRGLDTQRFKQDVRAFLDIYNRSMVNHWGFSPMSEGELDVMARGLRHLLIPELVVGAEIDGRLVGIILALPDYNPRIKQIGGRLLPFGFLRLLWGKRKLKRIRILAANVVPECQLMGVAVVLLKAIAPKALEYGVQEAEFSWVAESNSLSRGSLEKGGAKQIKTYRVYDLDRAADGSQPP